MVKSLTHVCSTDKNTSTLVTGMTGFKIVTESETPVGLLSGIFKKGVFIANPLGNGLGVPVLFITVLCEL